MLCEICHQREATCHLNTIKDGAVTTRDLCDECFAASNPTQAHELTTAMKTGCRYCGGEPFSGGYDPLALMGGTHRVSFMCEPCAKEHIRYLREKWPGFGDVGMTREQMSQVHASDIPAVFRDVEEHMKKWVADRGSL